MRDEKQNLYLWFIILTTFIFLSFNFDNLFVYKIMNVNETFERCEPAIDSFKVSCPVSTDYIKAQISKESSSNSKLTMYISNMNKYSIIVFDSSPNKMFSEWTTLWKGKLSPNYIITVNKTDSNMCKEYYKVKYGCYTKNNIEIISNPIIRVIDQ